MALPLLALIGAGVGGGLQAVQGYRARRQRRRADLAGQAALGAEETAGAGRLADTVSALRAEGAAKEKMAFRTGLTSAAERGVAIGSDTSLGSGGLSGLARQVIDPLTGAVRTETESGIMKATQAERERIAAMRQAEADRAAGRQAGAPQGMIAGLFS